MIEGGQVNPHHRDPVIVTLTPIFAAGSYPPADWGAHRPASERPSACPAGRGVLPAPGLPGAPPVWGAARLPGRGLPAAEAAARFG